MRKLYSLSMQRLSGTQSFASISSILEELRGILRGLMAWRATGACRLLCDLTLAGACTTSTGAADTSKHPQNDIPQCERDLTRVPRSDAEGCEPGHSKLGRDGSCIALASP